MNPVALQIPGREADEFVIAKDQPPYTPLPAARVTLLNGELGVVTRWRPSEEERMAIASGADIWVQHLTFGGPLQPLWVGAECPIEIDQEPS